MMPVKYTGNMIVIIITAYEVFARSYSAHEITGGLKRILIFFFSLLLTIGPPSSTGLSIFYTVQIPDIYYPELSYFTT